MKSRHYLLLLVVLLFTSCGEDKWWGDHLISKIEYDSGAVEVLDYDSNGQLTHYYYGKVTQYDSVIYYDVSIEHLDTILVMKGTMPYQSFENSGYQYGESVYKLNKNGLAKSCITVYPNDTSDFNSEAYSSFGYKKNQLSEISNVRESYNLSYEDNDITYKVPSSSSGFVMMTTFVDYTKQINKSGLPLILESFLLNHRSAFFAGILGRAPKHLPDRHAQNHGGAQFVYDYSYDEDAEGYVTSVNESRSSNLNMGMFGDLLSGNDSYKITYKKVDNNNASLK